MSSVIDRLADANQMLKENKTGVSIGQKGQRLFLRAIFPPRPGSDKVKPFQQRLFPGFHANPGGLKEAVKEAKKIGALLECKEFTWEDYIRVEKPSDSVSEWIKRFEENYFNKRSRTPQSETTWKTDYLKIFNRLSGESPLTANLLQQAILDTPPDTRTRKRACMVLGALARFAELEFDVKGLVGSYQSRTKSSLEIPSDEEIVKHFYTFKNLSWRWVYGMLATYGLRPHEVFRLDYDRLNQGDKVVWVNEDTKTGQREVWPIYPEWFEQFELSQVLLPPINRDRPNVDVGHAVTQYFSRNGKLPFEPYALRHAWAVRSLAFHLPISLAAQLMGHSATVHTQTYHRWITRDHRQKVYEALMLRSDRPCAPVVAQDERSQ